MSPEAYHEILFRMSSGDHGSHTAKELKVTPDQLQDLMYHRGPGLVDLCECEDGDSGSTKYFLCFYDAKGDCNMGAL